MLTPSTATRLTLYLPDRDQNGVLVQDIELWVNEAFFLLATMAGGATRPPAARGIWYNRDKRLFIHETTHLIYTYCEKIDFRTLQEFVGRFLVAANQQSVAVEIGDCMHFMGGQPTAANGHVGHMEAR